MSLFTEQKQAHRFKKQTLVAKGGKWQGGINWEFETDTYTTIFKIENQQGPTLQHKELCSVFCNNLNGERI